ncbi:MAG: thioredoxin-dependent thiol peroxidase [Candidatus Limnocylindrales bacterium]
MDHLQPGDPAPDFELVDDAGTLHRLSAQRPRPTVIYFYPKDMTPGCTTEACEFRDANDEIRALGAEVWGISPQDERSHARFREAHALSFPLLVDRDHAVAQAYGAWAQKTRYGRTSWGMSRETFLVDGEGRIAKVWANVRPEGHAREVLDALRKLKPAAGNAPVG